jgi:anthranilate synthase/aminodeoxychorismate synthase-like glutamine amidotransferase
MILLIDSYDSFVFNLERYFVRLGQAVMVVRNDDPRLANALQQISQGAVQPFSALAIEPAALILSPGPKRPSDAGYCLELVRRLSGKLPILGVCLGHQVIYEAFGGQVVRASVPMHGRASPMRLGASRLFAGLPHGENAAEVAFARYHSLIAQPESLPSTLQVTAWSSDGQIMAIEHRQHATFGVQFHPESILSPHGYRVLHNFLSLAGLPVAAELPSADGPSVECSVRQESAAAGDDQSRATPDAADAYLLKGPFASLPTVGTH